MVRKRLKKFLNYYWWAGILLLTFILRLPSLFEPFTYGDEGIYLTLGQALRKGLVLYRDIHDNKPPLLYLLASLAGNFSLYRILLLEWSLLTVWFFSRLASLIFKNKNAQIFTTFLFSILTSLRTLEGNVGNAENFMILPTLLGFYFYLKAKRKIDYFLVGFFFAIASLFKIPAVFDFGALIFLVVLESFSKRKKRVTQIPLMIAGFFFPFLLTFGYFAWKKALIFYIKAAFFQNIPYLSSWVPDKATKIVIGKGVFYSFINRSLFLIFFLGIIFCKRKKFSFPLKIILPWFGFSLFAALLSARPYPHYLLQLTPSLSLASGIMFEKKEKRIIFPLLMLTSLFFFFYFKFWHYPNLPYYRNFFQFILSQKSKKDYFYEFDKQAFSLYQTAYFIHSHTLPHQKIFIWGNYPSIYALAKRLPTGRFTVAYHIIDFNAYSETVESLKRNPPIFIILSGENLPSFTSFSLFLNSYYLPIIKFGEFQIFRFSPSMLKLIK